MSVRAELPDPPLAIAGLPVDHRGYPVPWFVGWIKDGKEVDQGQGEPDFRVVGANKITLALTFEKCWICGGRLGQPVAYMIGPMCAVNRNSAEPPSHRECAIYAAKACPFLVRPHARRRETGLPDERVEPAGIPIRRNPGVALVWVTDKVIFDRHYRLFDVGDPIETLWFAEGREATRAEVVASIESGLPLLLEVAEEDGPDAVAELSLMTESAFTLVPA